MGDRHERYRPSVESKRTVCQDIDVIRTGGPAVTEDVLAELLVSTRVLGSKEIMLLNHTGCGFTTFTDAEFVSLSCSSLCVL
jgi:carbonic anhydrase